MIPSAACSEQLMGHRCSATSKEKRWCYQCWWQFEHASGSRITVASRSGSAEMLSDGEVLGTLQEGFVCGEPWLVYRELHEHGALGPVIRMRGLDVVRAKLGERARADDLPWGCAVAVAAWGFEAGDCEPWSLLQAFGGPEKVEVAGMRHGEPFAFAMVGICGLKPGKATVSAAPDLAVATRRVYSRVWEDPASACT